MSEVAQSCPTLCNPVDCNLLGFSVHGILQARILEWIAISFSRGSSRPRDRTRVSCIGSRRFNLWATRESQICRWHYPMGASLVAQRLKRLPPMQETRVRSLGGEDPLEKEMATHSSILAWRISWTEEPGRLLSTGSQRVGHYWNDLERMHTGWCIKNIGILLWRKKGTISSQLVP